MPTTPAAVAGSASSKFRVMLTVRRQVPTSVQGSAPQRTKESRRKTSA
jgi:hypothetical protein